MSTVIASEDRAVTSSPNVLRFVLMGSCSYAHHASQCIRRPVDAWVSVCVWGGGVGGGFLSEFRLAAVDDASSRGRLRLPWPAKPATLVWYNTCWTMAPLLTELM